MESVWIKSVICIDCSESLNVARSLLKAGAPVNAPNSKKRTPLHLAVNANTGVANSSTEMEQILLMNGANVLAADSLGRLPLHYVFIKIGK